MHESNKVFSDKIKDLNIKIKEERERASKNVYAFSTHTMFLIISGLFANLYIIKTSMFSGARIIFQGIVVSHYYFE